jgi:hypothetical protein
MGASIKGGDKLEAKLAEIARLFSNASSVRIGFLEKATYPNGTPVAMVAAIQEFGAPKAKIPPRPFFRNMIAAKKGEWPGAIAALLKANQYDAKLTLEQTGAAIAGQLRQSIVDILAPPLSPVTLMLRKMFGNNPSAIRGRDVAEARRRVASGESASGVSTKPLVWTGHLLNSVDYEVKS